MNPKISVIIPMYNTEKFIGLAIESVLAQTFSDLELILIDDCSTDRTLEVAKSINDPRIEIIENKENLGGANGPGVVRNIGLARARGEYIFFMDNDDVLLRNGLKTMLKHITERGADAIINTKHLMFEDNETAKIDATTKLKFRNLGKMSGSLSSDLKTRLYEEYSQKNSSAAPWMHFYRHKFLKEHGLKFREAVIQDDGIFLVELLCETDNIIKIDEALYIWRYRNESLSHSTGLHFDGFTKRVSSFLSVMDSFEEILSKALQREYGEIDYGFIDSFCLTVKDRAIVGPLVRFYDVEPEKCRQIIRDEVEKRYTSETALIRKLLTGYFTLELERKKSDAQNIQLQMILKAVKGTVNRLIPF